MISRTAFNQLGHSGLLLAVGYSVGNNVSRRELAIGFDLNLRAIGTTQPELMLLRNTVDMIHLPAPAVKLVEGDKPRWYLFHRN